MDIQFIRKTGGIGWHRPTRSVRIRVIDYIFSTDRNPNIVLVGNPEHSWWSRAPYEFIIRTAVNKARRQKNLSFYIIEEESAWFKKSWKNYSQESLNIDIVEERKIGSVKIIVSPQLNENLGVILMGGSGEGGQLGGLR